jgi:hypothetical protein
MRSSATRLWLTLDESSFRRIRYCSLQSSPEGEVAAVAHTLTYNILGGLLRRQPHGSGFAGRLTRSLPDGTPPEERQ